MEQFWDDLKRQNLKGKYVFPTAATVFPVTFISSLLCILLGVLITNANNSVKVLPIDYGNGTCSCGSPVIEQYFTLQEDWKASSGLFSPKPISLFYRIEGFYVTQRRLQLSHCWPQLGGEVSKKEEVEKRCLKFLFDQHGTIASEDIYNKEDGNSIRAPLGSRANVMFNDTFSLTLIQNFGEKMILNQTVPFTSENILTKRELQSYRKETNCNSDLFRNTSKPRYWKKHMCEFENGYQNVDFVVWMRPEFKSEFQKIYRRIELTGIFKEGLPKGRYVMRIENNWAVCNPKIKKSFVLIMPSWYGNKDFIFYKICYVIGFATFGMGIFMLVKHAKYGKTLEEMADLSDQGY